MERKGTNRTCLALRKLDERSEALFCHGWHSLRAGADRRDRVRGEGLVRVLDIGLRIESVPHSTFGQA